MPVLQNFESICLFGDGRRLGDIPFSEFNVPGLTAPAPDSSKDIYNALIALLEEGVEICKILVQPTL